MRVCNWGPCEQEEYITELETSLVALGAKYQELLFGVAKKWPGETRHQTALRYILRAEEQKPEDSVACAKS